MNLIYNYQNSDAYIYNIAFIRALLIKQSINNLQITIEEKEKILASILEYLKKN